jgi:hypothetical protein
VALPCLRIQLAAVLAIAKLHCQKLHGGEVHVGVMLLEMLQEVGTRSETCFGSSYRA